MILCSDSEQPLQGILFEAFHEAVNAMQLTWYIDAPRTVFATLVAPYTVAGLTQLGDTAVIAHKESTPCFAIFGVLTAFWHIPSFTHLL